MSIWPRQDAVPGAGRVGVVQVVPRLAAAEDRQRPEVRRPVAAGGDEGPVADDVADRVDRPGHVVQQRDPDEAGPEERRPGARPALRDEAADDGRQGEAEERPEDEQPAGGDQAAVLQQVGGVPLGVGLPAVEQPAQVGVEHALDQRAGVVAVAPRRVRVALAVGEGVVPAVVGDPLDDGALDRHAADRGQRQPQRPDRLERAVREVPVVADRHAEQREEVEADGQTRRRARTAPSPRRRGRRRRAPGRGRPRTRRERAAPVTPFSLPSAFAGSPAFGSAAAGRAARSVGSERERTSADLLELWERLGARSATVVRRATSP